jgi:hypothetical protein
MNESHFSIESKHNTQKHKTLQMTWRGAFCIAVLAAATLADTDYSRLSLEAARKTFGALFGMI